MSDGPIFHIPDDHIVHKDFVYQMAPPDLWHLQRSRWNPIWNRVSGRSIRIAILDTGFSDHPDLPTPIATKSFIRGESVIDGNGHGTHCAGTSIGRNGLGVAPGAEIIVGKVLSNNGAGGSDGIVNGIDWAADMGADVISLSLGSSSPYGPTQEAARRAIAKGAVLVAAAGNAGYNGRNTIGYPAKYPEFLTIGAIRQNESIASFSSGGAELDVATPGENIISANTRGGYVSMSGTSMATPFMAGMCALVIELKRREGYASMTGAEAWRQFLSQWTKDKGAEGKDPRYGYGIPRYLDIMNAFVRDDIKWT